jgi:competence ComEA-like helix-hairpin-helix protein
MFKAMGKALAMVAVVAISTSAMAAEKQGINRKPRQVSGVVNINTGTAKQLELLPGVGPRTARLIVEHREKQPFKAPAEILNVKGVGPGIYRKIKAHITVSGATTLAVVRSSTEAPKDAEAAEPSAGLAPKPDGAQLVSSH